MKLTVFIITLACLQVSAKVYSQISLSEKNAPLAKVISDIQQQSGYSFFYKHKLVENINVSADLHDVTLQQALDRVLANQPLTYEVVEKTVVIKQKEPLMSKKPSTVLTIPIVVTGKVTDTTGTLLPSATVKNVTQNNSTVTGEDGTFKINAQSGDQITVSFIGYSTYTFVAKENLPYQNIILHSFDSKLSEVVVSTGYQTLPKERATGSFVQINNELLNRRVSTDILSRLEGVVPGLLFNRNTNNSAGGNNDISIRGTNTLYANNQPLVILDNFPYDGNINNINPNDIENITVLKDAAAASIWGVRSGNGVIVVTTKKGKLNQKLTAELNANITIGNKPDLYYGPYNLKATDFIDIEQNLFSKGYYNNDLNSGYTPVTPVVQILANQRAGIISSSTATDQINALRNIDVRDQLNKYFYQKSVNQQYALNLRGGNSNSNYTFSLGDDQGLSYYKGNSNGRITINSLYNFYPVKNLMLSAGLNYTQTSTQTNNPIYNNGGLTINNQRIYPYAQLVDANGNSLSIAKDFATAYTSTVNNKYLDWNYRPLDELNNADNTSKSIDNRINLGAQYDFLKHFSASLKYQYEHAVTNTANYNSQDTYYTRNLINEYTQVNADGSLNYPIPVGGILQQTGGFLTSHRGRAQVNYSNTWNQQHELNVIAGAEISEAVGETNSNTTYGYNKGTETSYANVDNASYFTVKPYGYGQQIPNSLGFAKTTDHYLSYFSNAAYTYQNKYTVSGSARIDKSNLFGVNTNQKAVPLYSAGFAWDLSRENFYRVSWLPYVKLRGSYGYTGNINKSATAVTTITQFSGNYYTGGPGSQIANPGNPELRWEKVRMINLGLDYAFKNDIVSGSLEIYNKKGINLFGNSPLAPSTGLTTFFGNTADTKGNGFDIVINTKNINGKNFKWTTNFLISHVIDIVTKYDVTLKSSNYINSASASSIFPLTGKSLYGLYSYKWAGLNATGNPQGYLNGQISTDYKNIISKTSIDDMVYNGSARPTTYGSFRNTFSYKALSLSFNIIYKFNYYFRRTSFTSSGLPYSGTSDYYNRWQKPGDELTTNVPAFLYPFNTNRDAFYKNSSVLIDKGDHIRLQDITLSYDLDKGKLKGVFSHLQVYSYINNIAILWRANKDHLDPDISTNYSTALPLPRTIAFGVKAKF